MKQSIIGMMGVAMLAAFSGCSGQDGEFYSEAQELGTAEQALTGTAYDDITEDYTTNPDTLAPKGYGVSCLLKDSNGDEYMLTAGGITSASVSSNDPFPDNGSATDLALLFDHTQGANSQWSLTSPVTVNPMNDPRAGAAYIKIADDKCLVAGGFDDTGAALATAEVFDIDTGVWTATANNMSVARGSFVLEKCGSSKFIAIGGDSSSAAGTFFDEMDVYNPATNQWAALPANGGGNRDLLVARSFPAVAAQDTNYQRFLIANGVNGGGVLNTVELLEVNSSCADARIVAGASTLGAGIQGTRWLSSAARSDTNEFLIFGGTTVAPGTAASDSLASSILVTVNANAWPTAGNTGVISAAADVSMSVARREMLVKQIDDNGDGIVELNKFAIIGGRNSSEDGLALDTMEVLDRNAGTPVFEDLSGTATAVDNLLDGRFAPVFEQFSSANASSDRSYVAGGVDRTAGTPPPTAVLSAVEGL